MSSNIDVSRRMFLGTGAAATVGLATAGVAAAKPENAVAAGRKADTLLAPTYKSHFGHDVTSDAVHAGENSNCSSYPIYQGTTNGGAYTRGSRQI